MEKTAPRIVLEEVQSLLPGVFTDYLWSLVEQEGEGGHTFFLAQKQMAGQMVQEIVHYAPESKKGIVHRIFGITPVNAAVRVCQYQEGYSMELAGPLEAAAMMGA